MKARILFISDFHKKSTNPSNMPGYIQAINAVQLDLLRYVRENQVTHVIYLGDLYDKGYRSINRAVSDMNMDKAMADAVSGNSYICLGNHFFLERDSNPEMYLIQPHPKYEPNNPIFATSPVIRAVPALRVGPVQISFFHYSKKDKNYRMERDSDAAYHIGVYHDDVVVPTAQRNAAMFRGTTPLSYIDSIYDNIDLAIVGHIHNPIGTFNVGVQGRTFPMIIPGSLAITSSDPNVFHTHVNLPIVEISESNAVGISYLEVDLHTNLLGITRESKASQSKRSETPGPLYIEAPTTVSLIEHLRMHELGDREVDLVEAAAESELSVKRGLELLRLIGGDKNNEL